MRIPINRIVHFVLSQCNKFKIDETHSLNHALDVLSVSKAIYNDEVKIYPHLESQQHIIFTSALVHDICDSKYTDEKKSVNDIKTFLNDNHYTEQDSKAIIDIISTMSYHKVKLNGFPNLEPYQEAYHVVREADLITAYDFNRMLLYGIHRIDHSYIDSFHHSKELYMSRVDKHLDDGLLTTQYAKRIAKDLNDIELRNMNNIYSLLKDSCSED